MNVYVSQCLQAVVSILAMFVAAVLVRLVHVSMTAIATKLKLTNATAYETMLDSWVTTGINAAEKAASNKLKAGQTMPSDAKLDMAIGFVTSQITAHKLPEQAADAIEAMVDAKLKVKNGVVAVPVVAHVDDAAKTPPKVAAVLAPLLFIFALCGLSGCAGNPYIDAYQTITGARYAATTTAQALGQYDHVHQLALASDAKAQCKARIPAPANVSAPVDAPALVACQQDLGKQLLADWDAKYKKFRTALDGVRTGLDLAEAGVGIAEKAKAGKVGLHDVLDPMKRAIKDLAATLKDAGVPPMYSAALLAMGGV
jgi:hypothetical protein